MLHRILIITIASVIVALALNLIQSATAAQTASSTPQARLTAEINGKKANSHLDLRISNCQSANFVVYGYGLKATTSKKISIAPCRKSKVIITFAHVGLGRNYWAYPERVTIGGVSKLFKGKARFWHVRWCSSGPLPCKVTSFTP